MFIVALFIIAPKWKQIECPSIGKCISANVIHPYKGILLNNKNVLSTGARYKVGKPWKHYVK